MFSFSKYILLIDVGEYNLFAWIGLTKNVSCNTEIIIIDHNPDPRTAVYGFTEGILFL